MNLSPSSQSTLSDFLAYLETIQERPNLDSLHEQLHSLRLSREGLQIYANFNEKNYARNLIFESDAVQLLCLCWRSGQRSPIHDHEHSICGVRIIEGIATETKFERVPSGFIKALGSTDFPENSVMVSQDADTHQISNLQEEDQDLVTLHLYAPPLNRMRTFSIESRRSIEYKPNNHVVLVDGGGI